MKRTPASITQDAGKSADANERRALSQKELAKEKRHSMYQSAKERRATDPRYLAMKEAAKVQRRAAYQKVKDRRKAVAADRENQAEGGANRGVHAQAWRGRPRAYEARS